MITLPEPIEFQWDRGNEYKNEKHGISNQEIEEVFFDSKKVIGQDILHSKQEERYVLLGQTGNQRLLYVVWTRRSSKVRVISVRLVSKKKERRLYE